MDLKLLPQEILNHIYEYDDSYKKYYSYHVLNEIWRIYWLNWFENMIIEINSENSFFMKEKLFFIRRIHLFDTEEIFPIICYQKDIQIKCTEYTSISFQVTVSIKTYNYIIFDGLVIKNQCYHNEITNLESNGYCPIIVTRDIILFEKNRKNEKISHYLLLFYILIRILFTILISILFHLLILNLYLKKWHFFQQILF
jgi:hypothetical protein